MILPWPEGLLWFGFHGIVYFLLCFLFCVPPTCPEVWSLILRQFSETPRWLKLGLSGQDGEGTGHTHRFLLSLIPDHKGHSWVRSKRAGTQPKITSGGDPLQVLGMKGMSIFWRIGNNVDFPHPHLGGILFLQETRQILMSITRSIKLNRNAQVFQMKLLPLHQNR